ncbi:MAG: carbamate kinase [Tissierellia bacterium]|nr:carbamate kinase [Tissierellia bacterium]
MKIVLALGGNALGESPKQQLELVKLSAKPIADLIEQGHDVIVAHGNGPQVGMINLAFEESKKMNKKIPDVPFAECNAMSQGYIGYHLQNALREELKDRSIEKSVATIITQVIVDRNDPAFVNPTKPIGGFYSLEEAEKLTEENTYAFVEDAGRGYRRVIASPKPLDIAEIEIISTLVDSGHLVIAVGGGGIPVYEEGHRLIGIDAVIDKDFASSKLAEKLNADYLIILTAVDQVAINFGKPDEKWLSELDVETTNRYIKEGHFAPGSMLPKVEAAKEFALSKKGRKALITSLGKASLGIQGKTGTRIENK